MATRLLSRSRSVFSSKLTSFLLYSNTVSSPSLSASQLSRCFLRPAVAHLFNGGGCFSAFRGREAVTESSPRKLPPKDVMEKPDVRNRDDIIDMCIKTLAQLVGSEEKARMKIYSVSTLTAINPHRILAFKGMSGLNLHRPLTINPLRFRFRAYSDRPWIESHLWDTCFPGPAPEENSPLENNRGVGRIHQELLAEDDECFLNSLTNPSEKYVIKLMTYNYEFPINCVQFYALGRSEFPRFPYTRNVVYTFHKVFTRRVHIGSAYMYKLTKLEEEEMYDFTVMVGCYSVKHPEFADHIVRRLDLKWLLMGLNKLFSLYQFEGAELMEDTIIQLHRTYPIVLVNKMQGWRDQELRIWKAKEKANERAQKKAKEKAMRKKQ